MGATLERNATAVWVGLTLVLLFIVTISSGSPDTQAGVVGGATLSHAIIVTPRALDRILFVYGEAACPDTKSFVLGPLASMMAILKDHVQVQYVPFGNAYYSAPCPGAVPSPPGCATSAGCLYNSTTRDCYFTACGKGSATTRPSSCYAGSPSCQHGASECLANRLQACAGAPLPFVACFFEALNQKGGWAPGISSSEDVQGVAKRCASTTPGLSWASTEACAAGEDGDRAVAKAARATPSHPGVPYAVIGGTPVRTYSAHALITDVCASLAPPLPAPCSSDETTQSARRHRTH
jgi:hypothetical protein